MPADGLEALDVDDCLALLQRGRVGRLAMDAGDGPMIVPVNYRLQQGTVLIRTDDGSKLDAAERQLPAALEVDDADADGGWSVVVRGRLDRVMGTQAGYANEPVPYPPGERPHLIALSPGRITGRRYGAGHARPRPPVPVEAGNVWRGRDGDDLLG